MRIAASLAALAVLFAVASHLGAQSFEVTSVKINRSGDGLSNSPVLSGGRMTAVNATMRKILQTAYRVSAFT